MGQAALKTVLMAAVLATATAATQAQETRLSLGMSGWTGFAPLTLAEKTGIFKKNGLEVELKTIPQKDRHHALASGAIQCAASTVETHLAWNANGTSSVQIFLIDKSAGADGIVVRNEIKTFADLKGKTIAVGAPGTSPYFALAWMLGKNGMSLRDVKTAWLEPQPAAQAFVAGQNDAAMTYEPYLSNVRNNTHAGKILATTLDYPMVMDTVGCEAGWLKENPKAAQALTQSYFEALDMIRSDPAKANEIMGAAMRQGSAQFARSATFLRWQDKAANQKFFSGELQQFMKESLPILLDTGVIRQAPQNLSAMFDTSFIK